MIEAPQKQLDRHRDELLSMNKSPVRVYLAEEQPLLREAYQSGLSAAAGIAVVGVSSQVEGAPFVAAAWSLRPDVVVIGTGTLREDTIQHLRELRRITPEVGVVVLAYSYDVKTNAALREFSRHTPGGCAYLLKHTVGEVDQLAQIIGAVAAGRIIMDPAVMGELVTMVDLRSTALRNLSPREMEVLGWMARAYRNDAIAHILHLEPKTVERHINNIYGKIGGCPVTKQPRVRAIGLFLRAAGYGLKTQNPGIGDIWDEDTPAPGNGAALGKIGKPLPDPAVRAPVGDTSEADREPRPATPTLAGPGREPAVLARDEVERSQSLASRLRRHSAAAN